MDTYTLADKLVDFERGLIEDALRHAGGNVSFAARQACIDRGQFYRRAAAVGIDIGAIREETRALRRAASAERAAARTARKAATRRRLLAARAGH